MKIAFSAGESAETTQEATPAQVLNNPHFVGNWVLRQLRVLQTAPWLKNFEIKVHIWHGGGEVELTHPLMVIGIRLPKEMSIDETYAFVLGSLEEMRLLFWNNARSIEQTVASQYAWSIEAKRGFSRALAATSDEILTLKAAALIADAFTGSDELDRILATSPGLMAFTSQDTGDVYAIQVVGWDFKNPARILEMTHTQWQALNPQEQYYALFTTVAKQFVWEESGRQVPLEVEGVGIEEIPEGAEGSKNFEYFLAKFVYLTRPDNPTITVNFRGNVPFDIV